MQHDPDIFSVINFRLHDIAITDINHQTLPSFSHAAEWRMNSSQAVEWHSERVRHCITECFFFEVSEINSSNFWCFLNAHKTPEEFFPRACDFSCTRNYFKLNFVFFLSLYLFIRLNCGFHFNFYFLSRGLEAMHEIINQFKSEWSVIWMFSEGGIAY